MATLTDKQREYLSRAIHRDRISHRQGMAHLEAWDVRRYLIRVFGYGGWDFQLIETALVSVTSEQRERKSDGKPYMAHTAIYRATGRLIIKDENGDVVASYDDAATGDGPNQPSLADSHDLALKTAVSQALKRCAINLGDQFGLSLYDDGSTEPVVKWSLNPAPVAELEREEVTE